MNRLTVALLIAVGVGTAIDARPMHAQTWREIAVGQMTKKQVDRATGGPTSKRGGFDREYAVYTNALGASRLEVFYDDEGVVRELIVYPSAALRESDLTPTLGGAKQGLGKTDDGYNKVDYLISGATVEYRSDGVAYRITLGAGLAEVGTQKTVERALMNELFKRKP